MNQIVDDEGKFKIEPNGTLIIIGLARSDAGMYTCIASNGIGPAALKQTQVQVKGNKQSSRFWPVLLPEITITFNNNKLHSLINE